MDSTQVRASEGAKFVPLGHNSPSLHHPNHFNTWKEQLEKSAIVKTEPLH